MTAKQQYKNIGKIIFIFTLVVIAFQVLFIILQEYLLNISLDYNDILSWVVTFAPIYLIGFPLSLLMFKKLPLDKAESQKIKISQFLVYFIECVAVMYIGNIIGTFLSFLLSNGQAQNPLIELTSNNSIVQVLVLTIIAPIIEEIIFRKKIIDHTIMYGEKVSIFFSAITFALFHMNLFQFFYAFGLGLIFGYIYAKTRNIKYSMIIHVIINFVGGVLSPFLVSRISNLTEESIELMSEAEIMKLFVPSLMLIVYLIILLALVIIGIVFLIMNRKKVLFNKTELDIPNGEVVKTVYLNVYYVLFVVICLATIISLLL